MSTPWSGSIEQMLVSATVTPESATDFFGAAIAGDIPRTAALQPAGRAPAPMAHRVTLIPGDGTGPELTEATRRVLEATGVEFDWDLQYAGSDVMDQHGGNPLPEHVLDAIRESGVALKGPITTPVGGGFRSVNVALRKGLDLYAQVRPCKSYPGVRSRYDDVDLVIVREATEDLYAGIEYETGSDEAAELTEWIRSHDGQLRDDSGISIKPISIGGTRRVVEFAFDYARRLGRRKVTSVHKANIMKFTDGLWLRVSQVIAEGKSVTYDMKPSRDDPTAVGTSDVADAIIEKLGVRV